MPSSLLIEDNIVTMITTSPEGRIEFLKDPIDKILVAKYGNLGGLTDKVLTMRSIVPVEVI